MYKPTDPLWLCEVSAQPVTRADCLACARERRQPTCAFNPALLRALAAANEPDAALTGLHQTGYPVLRVSSLTGCIRQSWYSLRSERRLEKPSEHWSRLRGVIFHAALEQMGDGHVEKRLTAFLYDSTVAAFISGRIDGYDPDTASLTDYKTTRRLPGNLRPHHLRQVHLYAWLLWKNGYGLPQAIRMVYISMAAVRSFDAAVPSESDLMRLEDDLLSRIRAILHDSPPPPIPQESWECKYCGFAQCPAHPGQNETEAEE
jgi:CRISPR/Cas system-associated exonuclease Cas4 (RecB family)